MGFSVPDGRSGDGNRVNVTFSMSGRDLSFLAYSMKFISGGIDSKDETLRGYWQVMFGACWKTILKTMKARPTASGPVAAVL